jgi:hypothetical protein
VPTESFFTAGDFSTHRTDAMAERYRDGDRGHDRNTTFANPYDNDGIDTDGYPWTSIYASEFSEMGLGLMLDADIHERTNIAARRAFDGSHARNTDFAAIQSEHGHSANPGAFAASDSSASAWDTGVSWSASLSHSLTPHLRPYATIRARQRGARWQQQFLEQLPSSSGTHRRIGVARARCEGERTVPTRCSRRSRSIVSDASSHHAAPQARDRAYASATLTRGPSSNSSGCPVRNSLLSLYALRQETRVHSRIPARRIAGRRAHLGVRRCARCGRQRDLSRRKHLPYGGRTRLVLPADMPEFGTPSKATRARRLGFSTQYHCATASASR